MLFSTTFFFTTYPFFSALAVIRSSRSWQYFCFCSFIFSSAITAKKILLTFNINADFEEISLVKKLLTLTNILSSYTLDNTFKGNSYYLANGTLVCWQEYFKKKINLNLSNIPQTLLEQLKDILKTNNTYEVKKLLAFERQRTLDFYNQAEKLLPKEDFKNMLGARIMGNIYKAIFEKTAPCIIFEEKIKLSKFKKILIMIKTWSSAQ